IGAWLLLGGAILLGATWPAGDVARAQTTAPTGYNWQQSAPVSVPSTSSPSVSSGPSMSPMLTFRQGPATGLKQGGSARSMSDKNAQMLVHANEIQYDYNNERVAAVGNVQIYYGGSTIEADRVIYDQKTKRLHAEGNARLTEP